MAETKTTIPVEIKMGNAGTNDANLPAFKEGSIIFTKDTKKIYIDPVGETERIAVGGTEVAVDSELSKTSTNPVQNKIINSALDTKQDKITNTTDLTVKSIAAVSILKAQAYTPLDEQPSFQVFSGTIGQSSMLTFRDKIAVTFKKDLQVPGPSPMPILGIATPLSVADTTISIADEDLPYQAANKKYVDDETAKKQDKFADLDYVWDGDSFNYLSLNLKSAAKKTSSTSGVVSPVSDLILSSEVGDRVYLTVGAITVDPIDNGRYSSSLSNTSLSFSDKIASATLPSILITPTAHNGTTPAYLTFASPAQNTAVGNANVRLTGIAAPTADNDAVNRGYLTTKYGSTYYESQDKQYYLPSGSNMVIPNSNMGRLFIGSESAASTDFKIYVNDPVDDGKLIITNLKTPTNNEDAANKAYVDTQVATKQAKFAEYTSTRPSEEAPASTSTNILVLNEGMEFYLRDRATNPLVEFRLDNAGVLQGTTNNLSLTTKNTFNLKSNIFTLSNDNDDIFQVVMDDSKKVVYYGLKGGDDNGSLYLTNTSRTAQQGATLQGNVSSDARTTALVVNESNTKLLSWKQGTTTNNAPLLGVSTPVEAADTSKGITANDLDYQAVNKKYVDDIKTELLNAITHPYTYDETTKELTLIL